MLKVFLFVCSMRIGLVMCLFFLKSCIELLVGVLFIVIVLLSLVSFVSVKLRFEVFLLFVIKKLLVGL